jgi:hypothetical protein
MGVEVRYERLVYEDVDVASGRCRIRGQEVILIDRKMDTPKRVQLLLRELRQMDLTNVYIKPYLRVILEENGDGSLD